MALSDLLGQPLVPLPGLWAIEFLAQFLHVRIKAPPTLDYRDRKEIVHQTKREVTAMHKNTN